MPSFMNFTCSQSKLEWCFFSKAWATATSGINTLLKIHKWRARFKLSASSKKYWCDEMTAECSVYEYEWNTFKWNDLHWADTQSRVVLTSEYGRERERLKRWERDELVDFVRYLWGMNGTCVASACARPMKLWCDWLIVNNTLQTRLSIWRRHAQYSTVRIH